MIPARFQAEMRLFSTAIAAASLLALSGCGNQSAQTAPEAEAAHPDLSGFWRLTSNEPPDP
jgi:hypothetical protein